MNYYAIAVVIGDLRRQSFHSRLANAVARLAPPEFTFGRLEIGDLPLYSQDDHARPARAVQRLKQEIGGSRGLLFVTPEYNRSISGVLKNALDHGSRSYGHNSWAGRPASVLGVSVGAPETVMSQPQLRNVLAYLDVPTMGQPEACIQANDDLFDAAGNIDPCRRQFLQAWMDAYVRWVKQHAPDG